MPMILEVIEIWRGRSGEMSSKGSSMRSSAPSFFPSIPLVTLRLDTSYVRMFMVLADSGEIEAAEILAHSSIPRQGDLYTERTGSSPTGELVKAECHSVRASNLEEHPAYWQVTAEYSSEARYERLEAEWGTLYPKESWDTVSLDIVLDEAYCLETITGPGGVASIVGAGLGGPFVTLPGIVLPGLACPVRNSAGDRFNPGAKHRVNMLELTVERLMHLTITRQRAFTYLDKVNSAPFLGYTPGLVLLHDLKIEDEFYKGRVWDKVKAKFLIADPTNKLFPDHRKRILDQGFMEIKDGKRIPMKDASGHPRHDPGLLDGSGRALPPIGGVPVYLVYVVYDNRDLNDLRLYGA